MKIIDATWELPNLGVVTKEVNLDADDAVESLEQIRNLDCEYSVVRVPAARVDLMFKLDDLGYRFIETIIHVQHDLKNIGSTLSPVTKRIAESITYAEMNEEDLAELCDQLKAGMFDTDRISLDPMFSQDIAAKRYIKWIKDEVARGGKVFKCVLKGKTFGYFLSRINDENINCVYHIGTYKEFVHAGLGVCLVHTTVRQAFEAGAKRTIGGFSSNNVPSTKANLSAGYQITAMQYVYIKHH